MNAHVLKAELASRRSRLWNLIAPDALAEWVYDDGDTYESLDAMDGAERIAADMRTAVDQPTGDAAAARIAALAIAGAFIRAAVPSAAATAGRHWMITSWPEADCWRARVTVGVSEVLNLRWSVDDFYCNFRVAETPLDEAVAAGTLDTAAMAEIGVERAADGLRSFAHDATRVHCFGVDAALWLMAQPAIWTAARLLTARLAAGSFPFARHYDANLAAEAWAAAEVVLVEGESAADPVEEAAPGFDRRYTPPTVPAITADRNFDAAAYLAGSAEHDALCSRLLEYLALRGIAAGENLNGVRVDLAWRDPGGKQFIAEVKSCADGNHTVQLRLGLGQLLEYRHRLAACGAAPQSVLVVSSVADPEWYDICRGAGVRLLAGDDESTWSSLVSAHE